MLERFLDIYRPISNAIETSTTLNEKNRRILRFSEEDIKYLHDCLDIFKIFIYASTKLQAENYPTIQYIYPYIYQIRVKLIEKARDDTLVSIPLFILYINTNYFIDYYS